MLFSSMIFIYFFMPIVCGIYLLAKPEIRNYLLLIASLLFYGWAEPGYLAIMILTIVINYAGALAIDKYQPHKRLILVVTIMLNLSFLFYFKYFNFVLENLKSLFVMDVTFIEVIMPIGISFYTFQAMSYLIDVYRQECKVQKDFYKLSLYIALFPQLVAGPIVKYHDIAGQIDNRQVDFEKVSMGIKRFIIGLAKKMLIANVLGAVVDKIFALPVEQFGAGIAWIGAVFYSLQLFFDFSGYSDMAIGLGLIFGFKFMENFNYPYISKSITEFWRRWHISLSTWFKQYLYISLGGNRIDKKRTMLNLFIVFLLTGIWHGAEWTFVVWGLWYGIFIILEKVWNIDKINKGWFVNSLLHLYVIWVFVLGWVIFRSDNLDYAWRYLQNMFGLLDAEDIYEFDYYITKLEVIVMAVGILCSMPVFKNLLQIKYEHKVLRSMVNIWLGLLFLLSSAAVAATTYNPFIYFRF